jgi:hypothetical protein
MLLSEFFTDAKVAELHPHDFQSLAEHGTDVAWFRASAVSVRRGTEK